MSKNILYSIVAGVVLVVLGAVAFYLTQQRPAPAPQGSIQPLPQQPEQVQGLGSELYQNPGSQVPDVNPLAGYKNPFE